MTQKTLPCSEEKLRSIISKWPTPFYLYDEKAIRENARRLKKAFSWNPGFRNFFAVKALPNPYIMRILQDEGFGADCSSLPELLLSEQVKFPGNAILFTSNDTPAEEFIKAKQIGAIINLDDLSHIQYLEHVCGKLPDCLCFRYNPGPLKGGNAIIGSPEEAKYGFTREQLFEGYRLLQEKGVRHFGIHTMVASNELNPQYFIDTAIILFNLIIELKQKLGIVFDFVDLGGGIGIPYKPDQDAVDIERVGKGIHQAYNEILLNNGHPELSIYLECGRCITGPYGYLVSTVRHLKHIYREYVGMDACMANLMRPALYGAYHHITVLGKEHLPKDHVYDVTGSLCENNDKFAIQRALPEIVPGDVLIFHDAGAHGHAMGFNYNGKLRSAELMLREDGSIIQIRRAETVADYFATLELGMLSSFH